MAGRERQRGGGDRRVVVRRRRRPVGRAEDGRRGRTAPGRQTCGDAIVVRAVVPLGHRHVVDRQRGRRVVVGDRAHALAVGDGGVGGRREVDLEDRKSVV